MEKIAYTIKETASALGCGINKTYDLVNSKKLRSFKFGKKIMIPVNSVNELIATTLAYDKETESKG